MKRTEMRDECIENKLHFEKQGFIDGNVEITFCSVYKTIPFHERVCVFLNVNRLFEIRTQAGNYIARFACRKNYIQSKGDDKNG